MASDPVWQPRIDVGGKLGNERSLGQAEMFLPMAQDGRSLLFFNPRFRIDDKSSREFGAGLGYRRLLKNDWIIGGYGFLDRLQSSTDNDFLQGVVGIEGLSKDWDLRVNGYLPLGDRSKPLAGAAGAMASLSGGTIVIGSLAREERALHGFDSEVGWRVPFFDTDADQQIRIFVGGFWFDSSHAEQVAGPQARAELRLHNISWIGPQSRITLSGEIRHDNVRDTIGFVGARLIIPLGGSRPNLAKLSALSRRMADPVVRDVDIVTQTVTKSEVEKVLNARTGALIPEAEVVTSPGDLNTAAGAMADNGVIIASGTFNIAAPIDLKTGQVLLGGGSTLKVLGAVSGREAIFTAPGARPTINQASSVPAIRLATNTSVIGLDVNTTAMSARGIVAATSDNVMIRDNHITTSGDFAEGVYLDGDGSTVSGNSINTNGYSSVGVQIIAGDGNMVTGNTVSTGGTFSDGINVFTGDANILTDNTITTTGLFAFGVGLGVATTNTTGTGNAYTGSSAACSDSGTGNNVEVNADPCP